MGVPYLFARQELFYVTAFCAVLTGSDRQHERLTDAVFQSVSAAVGRRRSRFTGRDVADVDGRRETVAADQRRAAQRRRRDRDRRAEPRDGAHPAAVPRARRCGAR